MTEILKKTILLCEEFNRKAMDKSEEIDSDLLNDSIEKIASKSPDMFPKSAVQREHFEFEDGKIIMSDEMASLFEYIVEGMDNANRADSVYSDTRFQNNVWEVTRLNIDILEEFYSKSDIAALVPKKMKSDKAVRDVLQKNVPKLAALI